MVSTMIICNWDAPRLPRRSWRSACGTPITPGRIEVKSRGVISMIIAVRTPSSQSIRAASVDSLRDAAQH